MATMFVSPVQFDTAMKEVNTAFDTASKRIEMLEEKLIKAQNDIEALTPVKAVKASK
tara:strand:- start:3352 stop:3522 length:171 start_codon:yes stop_codon:yes gene_type:complete